MICDVTKGTDTSSRWTCWHEEGSTKQECINRKLNTMKPKAESSKGFFFWNAPQKIQKIPENWSDGRLSSFVVTGREQGQAWGINTERLESLSVWAFFKKFISALIGLHVACVSVCCGVCVCVCLRLSESAGVPKGSDDLLSWWIMPCGGWLKVATLAHCQTCSEPSAIKQNWQGKRPIKEWQKLRAQKQPGWDTSLRLISDVLKF